LYNINHGPVNGLVAITTGFLDFPYVHFIQLSSPAVIIMPVKTIDKQAVF
jgi:hypothetical protein